MVTYQIQIPKPNLEAFLNIIRSLQSLGMVFDFAQTDNVAYAGKPMAIDKLLGILKESEVQAAEGNVIPANEVISLIKSWRENR